MGPPSRMTIPSTTRFVMPSATSTRSAGMQQRQPPTGSLPPRVGRDTAGWSTILRSCRWRATRSSTSPSSPRTHQPFLGNRRPAGPAVKRRRGDCNLNDLPHARSRGVGRFALRSGPASYRRPVPRPGSLPDLSGRIHSLPVESPRVRTINADNINDLIFSADLSL